MFMIEIAGVKVWTVFYKFFVKHLHSGYPVHKNTGLQAEKSVLEVQVFLDIHIYNLIECLGTF